MVMIILIKTLRPIHFRTTLGSIFFRKALTNSDFPEQAP